MILAFQPNNSIRFSLPLSFALLCLFLAPNTALSDSCSTIEIDASVLGEHPTSQGNRNWCYAHVAADLVSLEVRQKISADDIAFEYEMSELKARRGNGNIFFKFLPQTYLTTRIALSTEGLGAPSLAMENINEKGYCLEVKLPSGPQTSLGGKNIIDDMAKNHWTLYGITKAKDIRCGQRIHLPSDRKIEYLEDRQNTGRLAYTIHELLEHGKAVGATYGIWGLGSHVVTVVGRKRDSSGICHFIVRDSQNLTKKYVVEERFKIQLQAVTYINSDEVFRSIYKYYLPR